METGQGVKVVAGYPLCHCGLSHQLATAQATIADQETRIAEQEKCIADQQTCIAEQQTNRAEHAIKIHLLTTQLSHTAACG